MGGVGSDSNQLPLLSAVANVTTAVDIYSFGMCALEVSCPSVGGAGNTTNHQRRCAEVTLCLNLDGCVGNPE